MTHHEREDKLIINTQFICFVLAFLIPLIASAFPQYGNSFIWKSADALVITGTVLLSIKAARDGWEMAAAGFILISIGWGGYFIQHEFAGETGKGVLASSFYFFFPSMLLISFYRPFHWYVKIVTLLSILPPLIVLILVAGKSKPDYIDFCTSLNFKFLHFTAFIWGLHFMAEKTKKYPPVA